MNNDEKEKLVMSDFYADMTDYIYGKLYADNKLTKPDNLSTVVPIEDIIKRFGGIGYSDDKIILCYKIIENNIMRWRE